MTSISSEAMRDLMLLSLDKKLTVIGDGLVRLINCMSEDYSAINEAVHKEGKVEEKKKKEAEPVPVPKPVLTFASLKGMDKTEWIPNNKKEAPSMVSKTTDEVKPVEEDDKEDDTYEVEEILQYAMTKKRVNIQKREMIFRVRWKGYSELHDTWEPQSSFVTPLGHHIIKAAMRQIRLHRIVPLSTRFKQGSVSAKELMDWNKCLHLSILGKSEVKGLVDSFNGMDDPVVKVESAPTPKKSHSPEY